MSSAFSDSSMSDDDALTTPFGGLQKYTSYGKHNLGQGQEPYQLRKTRPPFSVTRTDSFSSGEDDLEDDDGFQEMTAENLFSTLLSRVKSLTRRIHDEHEEHLLWQQKQRLGPPKLNPGGTHARLERTAQRNSIKRDREAAVAAANAASRPPASYSRQSSTTSFADDSLNRSYGSSSNYGPTKIYNRSNSYNNNTLDSSDRYSMGGSSRYSTLSGAGGSSKRYDEDTGSDYSNSNISVTSSQRLRPGYLPPPVNINSTAAAADNYNNYASLPNRASAASNDANNELDAHTVAQTIINRAHDKTERTIPINIQRESNVYVSSPTDTGTSLQSSSTYQNRNSKVEPDVDSDGGYGGRRISRFLRPDFYDTAKEDSVYAKMRDYDEDSSRSYMRANAGSRTGKSGRSTPLDFNSRTETLSPQFCDTSMEAASEGQSQNKSSLTSSLTRRNSLREPSRLFNNSVSCVDSLPTSSSLSNPPPTTSYSRINYNSSELPVENNQLYRRTIRPYTGAKSDGQLLTKHANVALNVIAAAERKKRQSLLYQPSEGEQISRDLHENLS